MSKLLHSIPFKLFGKQHLFDNLIPVPIRVVLGQKPIPISNDVIAILVVQLVNNVCLTPASGDMQRSLVQFIKAGVDWETLFLDHVFDGV